MKLKDIKFELEVTKPGQGEHTFCHIKEPFMGYRLCISFTGISCGIAAVHGLSTIPIVHEHLGGTVDHFTILNYLVKRGLDKSGRHRRYIIVSDAVSKYREQMHKSFTDNAVTTSPARSNPNSGSKIVMWTFDLND